MPNKYIVADHEGSIRVVAPISDHADKLSVPINGCSESIVVVEEDNTLLHFLGGQEGDKVVIKLLSGSVKLIFGPGQVEMPEELEVDEKFSVGVFLCIGDNQWVAIH